MDCFKLARRAQQCKAENKQNCVVPHLREPEETVRDDCDDNEVTFHTSAGSQAELGLVTSRHLTSH